MYFVTLSTNRCEKGEILEFNTPEEVDLLPFNNKNQDIYYSVI